MKSKYKLILLFSVLLAVLPGCEKHRAKKLAGTYSCSVHYEYWDMSPKTIDSVYSENLEITQDGETLLILGATIHVSELKDGKLYKKSSTHTNFEVSVKKDDLYLSTTSGGLGGEATYTYTGKKICSLAVHVEKKSVDTMPA